MALRLHRLHPHRYLPLHLHFLLPLVLIFLLQSTNEAQLGIDHSNLISIDQFKCLLQQNQTFVLMRAWRSYGAFDVNVVQSLDNAFKAGFRVKDIGVYMFPCAVTHTPEYQVEEMLRQLEKSQYSEIWIDLQTNPSPNCGWSSNFTYNCFFTQKLVQSAQKSSKKIGIYASAHMWTLIMGSPTSCPMFNHLPLWYPHYDNTKSFSDFKQFGGWQNPTIKQYKGTSSLCGISGLDLNFRDDE